MRLCWCVLLASRVQGGRRVPSPRCWQRGCRPACAVGPLARARTAPCKCAGMPTLVRPAGRDVVRQLMSALAAAKPHASGAQRACQGERSAHPRRSIAPLLMQGRCKVCSLQYVQRHVQKYWHASPSDAAAAAARPPTPHPKRRLPDPLLPPASAALQTTLCAWQRRLRAACRQRSARATGCATCCSLAGAQHRSRSIVRGRALPPGASAGVVAPSAA